MTEACECRQCASPFVSERTGGPRPRYCSRACKEAARYNGIAEVRALRVTRQCPSCGEPFVAKYGRQKTCGVACARAPKIPREGRRCIVCDDAFVTRANSTRKCCSKGCQVRLSVAHVQAAAAESHPRPDCYVCGERVPRADAWLCSKACMAEVMRQRAMWRKAFTPWPEVKRPACVQCGRGVPAGRISICSDQCATERQRDQTRASVLRAHERLGRVNVCRTCSTEFRPEYGHGHAGFCSDVCRRRAKAAANRKRKVGLENHRRRARHYGVAYEPIKRREILERDGYRCGICRKRIRRSLKPPHPMSASIDHIVPMAMGGGHVRANVQAAHSICNSRKSAGPSDCQLLLVG